MCPIFIRIGPLTIHTYGVLVAAGFLVGIILAVRQGKREGIPSERIVDLGFYLLLAAIIGSRLFFVALNASHYLKHPLDVIKIWEGGLVFYGGLLLALPTAFWYLRRHRLDTWTIADIFAPSIALGHAIGRLGCLSAGCCYGRPAEGLPWAFTFRHPESLARIGIPLHPVQLYESIGELAIFLVLIILRKRQSFRGQLFWTYIILYSVLRLAVEFFRGDEARGFILPGISVAQAISVLMILSAFVAMKQLSRKTR